MCARTVAIRASALYTRDMTKPLVTCQLCRKRVHKQRDGSWYHDRNASWFCHPGDGTGRKAIPVHVREANQRT
jgi:hypothetical protein